jgi:pimeloyl-ACP methyl ester carboxylesterase
MPPRPGQLAGLLLRRPRAAVAVIRLGALAMGPAEKAFRRGDDEAAIRAFGHGVLGKRRFRALSDERYRQIWENRGPDRAQILGAGFPSLADDDVAAVDIPVLLVCGRESPAVFHRVSQRLLHLLPDARRVVIDGASHIVHEDAPESFNTEALRFLSMH